MHLLEDEDSHRRQLQKKETHVSKSMNRPTFLEVQPYALGSKGKRPSEIGYVLRNKSGAPLSIVLHLLGTKAF